MFSFIETKLLTKPVMPYLSDESDSELQAVLIANTEKGAVIRGSGRVRKIRWAAEGHGKSSGYRVIFFVRNIHGLIRMLTSYPKNVADSIPDRVPKKIREEIESRE